MSVVTPKFRDLPLSPEADSVARPWSAWLPKTMVGMVAAGCLLAGMPLLVTVVLASVQLERLTGHSHQLMDDGLTVVRLGAQLHDNVIDLERNARQYAVLADPELLKVFNNRLEAIEITLRQIEEHDFRAAFVGELARARDGLTDAVRSWNLALQSHGSLDDAIDKIHSLTAQSDVIIASGRAAIDAESSQLRRASLASRRLIFVAAMAVIPLTALLAWAFSLAVTRPLRRLAAAIGALGHSQYEKPIVIRQPAEMQVLGERLDWLRRRLAQLEADKDAFLRHVSHELKTPLASLREGAVLLHDGSLGPLAPQQQEVAQILAESARELGQQIDNLLTYAEWREERRHAEAAWFDTRPLVEEVLHAQRLPMARRHLRTELDLAAPRLFGQRARLRVALDNLIGNALKHAPAGSAIRVAARQDATGGFELAVRDYGRGVAASDKQRIFEPFVRGTEAEEFSVRGTGVGLSIVMEAAMAHDGSIEVEDACPGARFVLRWPGASHAHA
ncbi:MAG TPA: HAMP domain-containing sensor histidine kinase [Candidatus Binatia bacterium]|nr:HAMP domain-containing sensor histidine kinase [Candidatus Binatia bacterium]